MRRYDAITDIPGIKVGHWSDYEAATGCTVILCESGATAGVDVRGSASGTYETDQLRPGYAQPQVNGVVLSGGSVFGLGSVLGVTQWCEEKGVGVNFGGSQIPFVSGAVISDLTIGRAEVRPGVDAGYAGSAAATSGPVAEGSVGGGTGATVAKLLGNDSRLKGGIGTASEEFGEDFVVGALVVVNAVGDIYDRMTGTVIAAPRGENGSFRDTVNELRQQASELVDGGRSGEASTTIGVVCTNVDLTKE